jgi:uncharacterized iron-regulated protein
LRLIAFALAVGLSACNATTRGGPAAGAHQHHDDAPPPSHAEEAPTPPVDPDVVLQAAHPFIGVRVADSTQLSDDQLLDELSRADVVCVGEDHADPPSHFAELSVIRGLIERSKMSGRGVGVGIEMLPRTAQPALDRWSKGELSEVEFLTESDWRKNWGYDFSYYRPQLELARSRGVEIVALNAPPGLTRKVARVGISGLSSEEEQDLPVLDLGNKDHRAWFKRQMQDHPMPHAGLGNLYAAQVVWDESMAESVTRWVGSHLPGRQMIVLAGAGHCRAAAIPSRIERRCGAHVVGVRPIVAGTEQSESSESDGFDFLFSMRDQ